MSIHGSMRADLPLRSLHSARGYEHRSHILVAARNTDGRIVALPHTDRLDAIGNDLSRHERVPHPQSTHGDGIRDSNGAKLQPCQLLCSHARLDVSTQFSEVDIARVAFPRHGYDADVGLGELLERDTGGDEHGLRTAPVDTLCDFA